MVTTIAKGGPGSSKPPSNNSTEPINWPIFQPLMPESDLALQEVLPGQIITIPNFWTSTLCKNYVSFLSSLPLTTTPGKPKKGDAVRVNDRFQVDDATFAQRLWDSTSLRNLVQGSNDEGALGLNAEERKVLWGGEVVIHTEPSVVTSAYELYPDRSEPQHSHIPVYQGSVLRSAL